MKRFRQWIPIVWLPAAVAFAQGPAAEPLRVEAGQAAVTVVFAPDYHLPPRPSTADRHAKADQRANLRSVETPPSRIPSAMTGAASTLTLVRLSSRRLRA